MNLPPLDKEMLAKMGIAPDAVPIRPAFDFGLNIQQPEKKTPKALTSDECIRLFGVREACSMNFIPQMLTALALEQAEEFIKYCRDHRLGDYKKHTREMRKCIDEYNRQLRESYGRSWYAYQNYLERLRSTVETDIFKSWCVFTNEASRQYVGKEHKEIPARVCMVRMLLTFVEDFDKNIDRVIAEKIEAPCNRKQDPWLFLISVLCIDIAETFCHKMEINDTMALCVRVLANRCRQVVSEIITEEDAEEAAKKRLSNDTF